MAIAADTNIDSDYPDDGPVTGPDEVPTEPDYAAYGLPTPAEAREDLGRWGAWRYKREVKKFFERVDEDAFYRGLGGIAVREAGYITTEERDEAIQEVEADRRRAATTARTIEADRARINAAMEAAYETGNVTALAAAKTALERLDRENNPAKVKKIKRTAGQREPGEHPHVLTDPEEKELRAGTKKVHTLAGEEYVPPKTRKQARAAKKFAALGERTKKSTDEAAASEGREVFLRDRTRKFKETTYTVKGDARAAARDLRTGTRTLKPAERPGEPEDDLREVRAERPGELDHDLEDNRLHRSHDHAHGHEEGLDEVIRPYTGVDHAHESHHLEHRKSHLGQGHEVYLPLNERMRGNYTPSERSLLVREAASAGLVEIERLVDKKVLEPGEASELLEKLQTKTAKRYEKASKRAAKKAENVGETAELNDAMADSAYSHMIDDEPGATEAEERAASVVHRVDLAKRFRRASTVGRIRGATSGTPGGFRPAFGINHGNEQATAHRKLEGRAQKLRDKAESGREDQENLEQSAEDLQRTAERLRQAAGEHNQDNDENAPESRWRRLRRFGRRRRGEQTQAFEPYEATWDDGIMLEDVRVIGDAGERDGVRYFNVEDRTEPVPEDQLHRMQATELEDEPVASPAGPPIQPEVLDDALMDDEVVDEVALEVGNQIVQRDGGMVFTISNIHEARPGHWVVNMTGEDGRKVTKSFDELTRMLKTPGEAWHF